MYNPKGGHNIIGYTLSGGGGGGDPWSLDWVSEGASGRIMYNVRCQRIVG